MKSIFSLRLGDRYFIVELLAYVVPAKGFLKSVPIRRIYEFINLAAYILCTTRDYKDAVQ